MDVIAAILQDQTLQVITVIALVAALADTVTGVLAAIRAGDFAFDKIAKWLGDHVLARVVPIVLLAFLSAALGAAAPPDADPALLALIGSATVGAWAAALAYIAETIASLSGNVKVVQTAARPADPLDIKIPQGDDSP